MKKRKYWRSIPYKRYPDVDLKCNKWQSDEYYIINSLIFVKIVNLIDNPLVRRKIL